MPTIKCRSHCTPHSYYFIARGEGIIPSCYCTVLLYIILLLYVPQCRASHDPLLPVIVICSFLVLSSSLTSSLDSRPSHFRIRIVTAIPRANSNRTIEEDTILQ
jgi:hypothetical protein